MRSAGTYRAAKRNAGHPRNNLALRDLRHRLGVSRRDYDRLQAMRAKSPIEYGLMMSFLQTKINAMGYVIGPHIRFKLTGLAP